MVGNNASVEVAVDEFQLWSPWTRSQSRSQSRFPWRGCRSWSAADTPSNRCTLDALQSSPTEKRVIWLLEKDLIGIPGIWIHITVVGYMVRALQTRAVGPCRCLLTIRTRYDELRGIRPTGAHLRPSFALWLRSLVVIAWPWPLVAMHGTPCQESATRTKI